MHFVEIFGFFIGEYREYRPHGGNEQHGNISHLNK